MNLGHANDEIKYDETVGTIAHYLVILDGEPTMTILCDSNDPEKVIRIRAAGNVGGVQATNGRFTMAQTFLETADGEPIGVEERVNEKSVYTYVGPRLHVLLGRLLRAAA
jgi:hypothetical protein